MPETLTTPAAKPYKSIAQWPMDTPGLHGNRQTSDTHETEDAAVIECIAQRLWRLSWRRPDLPAAHLDGGREMITALTHRIGIDGRCQDCGKPLIPHVSGTADIYAGEQIGLVETTHGGSRAYKVGEHDSNEACK